MVAGRPSGEKSGMTPVVGSGKISLTCAAGPDHTNVARSGPSKVKRRIAGLSSSMRATRMRRGIGLGRCIGGLAVGGGVFKLNSMAPDNPLSRGSSAQLYNQTQRLTWPRCCSSVRSVKINHCLPRTKVYVKIPFALTPSVGVLRLKSLTALSRPIFTRPACRRRSSAIGRPVRQHERQRRGEDVCARRREPTLKQEMRHHQVVETPCT